MKSALDSIVKYSKIRDELRKPIDLASMVNRQVDRKRMVRKINIWVQRDVKYSKSEKLCLFCGSMKTYWNSGCKKCGNGSPLARKIENEIHHGDSVNHA